MKTMSATDRRAAARGGVSAMHASHGPLESCILLHATQHQTAHWSFPPISPRSRVKPEKNEGTPIFGPRDQRCSDRLDLPPKLIQLLCDFSGLVSLARKGPRRQIAERRVRPSGIIVVPPTFDSVSGVVQR